MHKQYILGSKMSLAPRNYFCVYTIVSRGNRSMCIIVHSFFVYRNSQGLPIFEYPPPKYSASRILEILLNPNMKQSLVAHDRPIQVEKSSTFVVDLTSLKHPDDVKKDMYGRWTYSGSHPEVFRCSFDEFDDVVIEKCVPGASGSNVYYLRRIRSSHPSNKDFRRMIAFLHG